MVLVAEGNVSAKLSEPEAETHEIFAGHSLLYSGDPGFVDFQGEGLVFVVTGEMGP